MDRPRGRSSCFAAGAKARLAVLLVVALAPGCSQDVIPAQERHLDRPSDVAFGCVVNVTDDAGILVAVAAPPEGCSGRIYFPDGGPDAMIDGDAGVPVPDANLPDAMIDGDAGPFPSNGRTWAFVVEEHRGEVAVVDPNSGVVDIDDLAPGVNGLPVGSLPVAIAMTTDGCYAVTSNKGSCDLSAIDVFKATSPADLDVAVSRLLVSATGGTVAARPEGIATRPALRPETTPCTGTPVGYAYVAYPSCHMVGVVNLADGNLVSTIRLTAAGPALSGPDATCPVECGELAAGAAVGAATDGPEPTTVLMDLDGTRLYVGAWNAPFLSIVTLDPAGLPASVTQVPLEAPLASVSPFGIEKMAISRDTLMAGTPDPDPPMDADGNTVWPSYLNEGDGGTHRFVYAITSDGTVRVIDVTPSQAATECDAQIDPAGVRGITDLTRLSCFPVGDLTNPPRRGDVRGPGIELPSGGLPLDVAFLRAGFYPDVPGAQPIPENLNGTFAVITALGSIDVGPRGVVYYVNVDDNNYDDLENPTLPVIVDLNLALPHQLRDNANDRRRALPSDLSCFDQGYQTVFVGPARNEADPVQLIPGFHTNASAEAGLPNARLAPSLHRVKCDATHAVYETSSLLRYAVPPEGDPNDFQPLREKVFHDLQRVLIEEWSIVWEGSLADEETFIRRGGARVVPVNGTLALQDDAGLFCELGAEELDILEIYGCDTDANCGFGEECYVHPDAPQGIAGMCLPIEQVNSLAGPCRDFLVSRRHYSITKVHDDHVEMVPRLTILPETPLEGCTPGPPGPGIDDDECERLHDRVRQEQAAAEDPPLNVNDVPRFLFACAPDESRGGPDRCVMQCDATNPCAAGSVCDGAGRCALGALPPTECLVALQQYEVFGGESFVAVGAQTGYLHPWIVSADAMLDGMCVPDPLASELDVGRFRRDEPACIDDTVTSLLPNPCSVTVSEPVSSPAGTVAFRDSYAVVFRNRGMRLSIADVLLDTPEGGDTKRYSPIPSSYGFSFVIGGGFFARYVAVGAYLPQRIRTGPDGALWILDRGDFNPTSSTPQGQMIRFTAAPGGVDGIVID